MRVGTLLFHVFLLEHKFLLSVKNNSFIRHGESSNKDDKSDLEANFILHR